METRAQLLRLAVLTLLACGRARSGPAALVEGAALFSVSADQRWIAAAQAPSAIGPVPVGDLRVVSTSGDGAVSLEPRSFSPTFDRSSVLLYKTGGAPGLDPGPPVLYGALSLWMPGRAGGQRLSRGYSLAEVSPPDHSWVLFIDSPRASAGGPDTRSGSCAPRAAPACAR